MGAYSFAATSFGITSQNSSFLNVTGFGTMKNAGFDDTVGIFTYTANATGVLPSGSPAIIGTLHSSRRPKLY
jgi:hypothetical protein